MEDSVPTWSDEDNGDGSEEEKPAKKTPAAKKKAKPAVVSKRKQAIIEDSVPTWSDEEYENEDDDDDKSDNEAEQPAKKKPAPKRKAAAKPTTTKSATTKSTSKGKPAAATSAKEAKKLYTDTLKAVAKRYLELDKKVKAMSPNSRSITVDNYAISSAKHTGVAKKLSDFGENTLAFNFVMVLADASHCTISSFRMSDEGGECCPPFQKLDQALLPLIEQRAKPERSEWLKADALPEVMHRWTNADAEVGDFRTGNGPNKQQRSAMDRQFIEWEKERREARRERREVCGDWVMAALVELRGDRDYLKEYEVGEDFGMPAGKDRNDYFRESIAKLEGIVGEREG